ncbi:MAG: hypothetical protein ABIB11_00220, partial [Candidatus Omnitrophota bacterium]
MYNESNIKWRVFFKTICLIVVLCFLVQDVAWATNGTPLWSVINGNKLLSVQSKDFTALSKISIPEDFGIITDLHNAGSDKVIINIQDAHSSLGAQESISSLIENLVNSYDLKLVAVEGGTGFIDTSSIQSYPEAGVRKDISDYFLKRGKINAAEYYKITSDSDVKLYGVEDVYLYKQNADCYIESLKNKGSVHRSIVTLEKVVSDLKQVVYSKSLKALDEKSLQYTLGAISFKDYWKYLGKVANDQSIDITSYTNIIVLSEASKIEERIDFQKAEDERQQLIELLSKKLSKRRIEKLMFESLSFKRGKIPSSVYHNHLKESAIYCDIDFSQYQNLSFYTEYINMYDDVIVDELFTELSQLKEEIQSALFRNADEELLASLSKRAEILVDLLDAKITNRQLEYYKENRSKFIPQVILSEISGIDSVIPARSPQRGNAGIQAWIPNQVGDDNSVIPANAGIQAIDIQPIVDALPAVEKFYEIAKQRDNAILSNTLNKMDADGRSLAVLVTGGFHTKGISKMLRDNGISYMVVVPKFAENSYQRPYEDIILNKKEPFEEILSQSEYYLAATTPFCNILPITERLSVIAEFALFAGTRAKRNGANKALEEQLKKTWVKGYEERVKKAIGESEGLSQITTKNFENALNFGFLSKDNCIYAEFNGNVFKLSEIKDEYSVEIIEGDERGILLNEFKPLYEGKREPAEAGSTDDIKKALAILIEGQKELKQKVNQILEEEKLNAQFEREITRIKEEFEKIKQIPFEQQ